MKYIFVTIDEFLTYGGKLEIGRTIYNEKGLEVGEVKQLLDGDFAIIETSNRSLRIINAMFYVKIPVQPIYV